MKDCFFRRNGVENVSSMSQLNWGIMINDQNRVFDHSKSHNGRPKNCRTDRFQSEQTSLDKNTVFGYKRGEI